jgi:hypothetical protein
MVPLTASVILTAAFILLVDRNRSHGNLHRGTYRFLNFELLYANQGKMASPHLCDFYRGVRRRDVHADGPGNDHGIADNVVNARWHANRAELRTLQSWHRPPCCFLRWLLCDAGGRAAAVRASPSECCGSPH